MKRLEDLIAEYGPKAEGWRLLHLQRAAYLKLAERAEKPNATSFFGIRVFVNEWLPEHIAIAVDASGIPEVQTCDDLGAPIAGRRTSRPAYYQFAQEPGTKFGARFLFCGVAP